MYGNSNCEGLEHAQLRKILKKFSC